MGKGVVMRCDMGEGMGCDIGEVFMLDVVCVFIYDTNWEMGMGMRDER